VRFCVSRIFEQEQTFVFLLIIELMFVYNVNEGGVIAVKGLLLHSLSTKQPLEIIYLSDKGEISQRAIVVEEIQKNKIVAFVSLETSIGYLKLKIFYPLVLQRRKEEKHGQVNKETK
jgi:hypothetical protein